MCATDILLHPHSNNSPPPPPTIPPSLSVCLSSLAKTFSACPRFRFRFLQGQRHADDPLPLASLTAQFPPPPPLAELLFHSKMASAPEPLLAPLAALSARLLLSPTTTRRISGGTLFSSSSSYCAATRHEIPGELSRVGASRVSGTRTRTGTRGSFVRSSVRRGFLGTARGSGRRGERWP